MTERVSLQEARRRGWLDDGPLRTSSEREEGLDSNGLEAEL